MICDVHGVDGCEAPGCSIWKNAGSKLKASEPVSLFTAPLNDVMDLLDYLQHDSWRCGYTGKCHCGLDKLTDKLGLERVKVEDNKSFPKTNERNT